MSKKEKAPQLTFECPKLWNSMPGSETERFCDMCQHTVHNLSLLSESERNALIAKSANERVCGTFSKDLSGNLISAGSQEELSRKAKAARLAAIAAGSIALVSCASQDLDLDTSNSHPDSADRHFETLGMICPPSEEGN